MSTTWYVIPTSSANQSFYIQLAAVTYYLTLNYRNVQEGGWFLDIADNNKNPLVQGIPLVTGADLLAQFGQYNFGGYLIVVSDSPPDTLPTFQTLGTTSNLYFGVGT